ncbi:MAG: hypothetical protein V1918_04925, partial [Planctomycetota bacterium]
EGARFVLHEPENVRTVLVLPFLDVRTFRDHKDPLDPKAAERARRIFLEALRTHPLFERKTVVAPLCERPAGSMSLAEALGFGERFHADLVIAGQLFSYAETRAASIPPRAGMFLRFFSVPERRLVFAGDDYQASGAPGGEGGRDAQARRVADAILARYAAPPTGRPGRPSETSAEDTELPPALLILPYHERSNPANLIPETGGGAVVTSIYRMELQRQGTLRLCEADEEDMATHKRLLTPREAVVLAQEHGADFVLRGEVVEFRRAKSVPSLWSAAISTAILAAQVFFAETSGVDIATEVYRASDGACVFARRDVSRQKYVVRTEKTVRALAGMNARRLLAAVQHPPSKPVPPIIDAIILPGAAAQPDGAAPPASATAAPEPVEPIPAAPAASEPAPTIPTPAAPSTGEAGELK